MSYLPSFSVVQIFRVSVCSHTHDGVGEQSIAYYELNRRICGQLHHDPCGGSGSPQVLDDVRHGELFDTLLSQGLPSRDPPLLVQGEKGVFRDAEVGWFSSASYISFCNR